MLDLIWPDFIFDFFFNSVCVPGVAEYFRNRDRIFKGPSEPPDELPASPSKR